MAWLVSALGIALALAGAVALASGSPYIQLEWGWTEVIAGTTALSAGVVTLAVGAVLFSLNRLRRALGVAVAALQGGTTGQDHVGPPLPGREEPEAGRSAAREAPGSTDAGRAPPSLDHTMVRPAVLQPNITESPGRGDRSLAIAAPLREETERFDDHRPSIDPESPLNVVRRATESARVDGPRPASTTPVARREADAEPPSGLPREGDSAPNPTVVGRYEAGGASYVLFSDGTIDVETESGTHRFASMQALREHIGQQDTVG